jgi:hypothetical protein
MTWPTVKLYTNYDAIGEPPASVFPTTHKLIDAKIHAS